MGADRKRAFGALAAMGAGLLMAACQPSQDSAAPTQTASSAAATTASPSASESARAETSESESSESSETAKPAAQGPAVDVRAGNHGSEDRVVFEFSGVENIKVRNHMLDETPPVRGGSGEPVAGLAGTSFLHVVVGDGVPMATAAPTSPLAYDLPTVKSAVVHDIEGGTLEATVGLAAGVDYEVLVQDNKVIVNMSQGPLGR